MGKKIIVSVSNDLSTDQRVERVCATLDSMGFEICLIGRLLHDSLDITRDYSVVRKRLFFNRGPLFYLELNVRIFFFLLVKKPDVLLANDLDTLLANYLYYLFRFKKIDLVYDSHEYFTEVPELIDRGARKVWLALEKWILPKLKHGYTVSSEIVDAYKSKYDLKLSLIRNLPMYDAEIEDSDTLLGDNILIYQGAINVSRGIELMIRCMKYLPTYNLYIFGSGDIVADIEGLIVSEGLESSVKYMGRYSPEELRSFTSQASLGLSFEEDVCLSYRYSLPNKMFDYIHAGVPVLVSDLPSMRSIVDEYGVGECLSSREPSDVASQIRSICDGNAKRTKYISNCIEAQEELSWDTEDEKLIELFSAFV